MVVTHRPQPPASRTSARSRFRAYKDESEKVTRKAVVKDSPALQGMREAFTEFLEGDFRNPGIQAHVSSWYDVALNNISGHGLDPTAKDIEAFSLALDDSSGDGDYLEGAGLFLSALVNSAKAKRFILHVGHLDGIENLGIMNRKHLTVYGSVGDNLGDYMEEGSLVLHGDAGDSLGTEMKAGRITVKGDAGDDIGGYMEGGRITIEGNAGDNLGLDMFAGLILVRGNAGLEVGRADTYDGHERRIGGKIVVWGEIASITTGLPIYGRIYNGRRLVCDGIAIGEFFLRFKEINEWVEKGEFGKVSRFLRFRNGKVILEIPLGSDDIR
jgi:hypothetical protein